MWGRLPTCGGLAIRLHGIPKSLPIGRYTLSVWRLAGRERRIANPNTGLLGSVA